MSQDRKYTLVKYSEMNYIDKNAILVTSIPISIDVNIQGRRTKYRRQISGSELTQLLVRMV